MPAEIRCLIPISYLLVIGCGPAETDTVGSNEVAYTEVFPDTTVFRLEEDPDDLLGRIGVFLELSDDGFAISDGMVPRVRRYDSTGQLLGAFGAFGEGPGEFRWIGGLAESARGKLLVIDPALARVSVLGDGLVLDTTYLMLHPQPLGAALTWGDSILLKTSPAARSTTVTLMVNWRPAWTLPSPGPPPGMAGLVAYPYWGSYGSTLLAASPRILFTAYSLRYPIYLYDRSGSPVDTLTTPPESYRPAPMVEVGAFTGPGSTERRNAWLASFNVIADIEVVDDTLLVVAHGVLRPSEEGTRPFEVDQYIDIYDIASRMKLAEGLTLPPGAKVLAGGSALYLLISFPPDPWTIVRADTRE